MVRILKLSVKGEYYINQADDGVVFVGRSNEKGTFFDAELPLTRHLILKKLTLLYDDSRK
jgi:hypothetical protein